LPSPIYIASLDVGTSSVRALLFDANGVEQDDFTQQIKYEPLKTADGGVEVEASQLLDMCTKCLDGLHAELVRTNTRPAGVAFSAFWHSFLGVSEEGSPTTQIVHLFDTRSGPQVEWLRERIDTVETHRRTGCILHTSYWPSKLLWLREHYTAAFESTRWWMSFGEYLHLKFFGQARSSVSMVSGSGIWNQAANQYDEGILAYLPIETSQLTPAEELDQPNTQLLAEYRERWSMLDGIPWYPALGDGACNNVGSGCVTKDRYALMVGTSGAMRVVLEGQSVEPPAGLWAYRVDANRPVFGGAISNGGEVFAWMQKTLNLADGDELEQQLAAIEPGAHGLTVLPFFAGERAPYWRADLRATISGMSLATRPVDILRASLESVALRFRQIYRMMIAKTGEPAEVMASGGALLRSREWTQMMADALNRPIIACAENEASSRGAALWVAERLGVLSHLSAAPLRTKEVIQPREQYVDEYDRMLEQQNNLFSMIH
jgi:gluconokinase